MWCIFGTLGHYIGCSWKLDGRMQTFVLEDLGNDIESIGKWYKYFLRHYIRYYELI